MSVRPSIVVICARDWPVRRNYIDVEFVNIVKLRRLGLGGAGHTGKLLV